MLYWPKADPGLKNFEHGNAFFVHLVTAGVPNATYQVSWKSARRFRSRRYLKFFTIHGRGGHLGHVTSIMSSSSTFLVNADA